MEGVPTLGRRRSRRHRVLESRSVEVGDFRVRAWISTDRRAGRPPVVLVHGVVSTRYLLPTAEHLARTHPVVAIDLPGFGASTTGRRALDIAELAEVEALTIRAMAIEHPVVVGHSIGAQVAVELARRRPGELGGLVLVGPSGDPAVRTALGLCGRWLATSVREPLAFNALALRELVGVGPGRMLATARAAVGDPVLAKLAEVGARALVVRGEYDGVAPPEWTEQVRAELGAAPVAVISGVAHSVVFSAPAELARLIAGFADEVAAE